MGRGHDVTSSDSSAGGMRGSEQAEARASLLNRPDLPGNIPNQNSVAFPPEYPKNGDISLSPFWARGPKYLD